MTCKHCQYEKNHSPECPEYKEISYEDFMKNDKWEKRFDEKIASAQYPLFQKCGDNVFEMNKMVKNFIKELLAEEREKTFKEIVELVKSKNNLINIIDKYNE